MNFNCKLAAFLSIAAAITVTSANAADIEVTKSETQWTQYHLYSTNVRAVKLTVTTNYTVDDNCDYDLYLRPRKTDSYSNQIVIEADVLQYKTMCDQLSSPKDIKVTSKELTIRATAWNELAVTILIPSNVEFSITPVEPLVDSEETMDDFRMEYGIDLRLQGKSASQLKNEGFSIIELRKAGYSLKQLKDAGYPLKKLIFANFSPCELRKEFSDDELLANGLSNAELWEDFCL